jgi:hypothetical protein
MHTNKNDNSNEYDLIRETRSFLDKLIETEETGVKSLQMKETLETLKEYKERLDEEKNPITIWNRKERSGKIEFLSDIESEIRWLEYALYFKHKNIHDDVESLCEWEYGFYFV